MSTPLTLKELAALLHLAPSTVSRALKGHPDISQATQEKVRELARQLHYKPDAIARGLRKKNSYLIAILVPALTDYFYARVVSRVIRLAEAREYKTLVLESQENPEEEAKACELLEKSGISGLLLAPTIYTQEITPFVQLQAAGIPVVNFERILGHFPGDKVAGDHYRGAYEAVCHLIESGCRKIAHFSGDLRQIRNQKKQRGYSEALREYHLPELTELTAVYHPETLPETLENWTRKYRIDGIFTVSDPEALEVLNFLRKKGYQLPAEIAVCGYGNLPACPYSCPSLSSVDSNPDEIALQALELLWKHLSGKNPVSPETRIIPNRLVVRESCLMC